MPNSTSTSSLKRSRGESNSKSTSKSESTSSKPISSTSFSSLVPEGDFPRGGGSGLTPLEYRQTLREARAEADREEKDDLFSTNSSNSKKGKSAKGSGGDGQGDQDQDEESRKLKRKKMNRDKQNAKRKKSAIDGGEVEKGDKKKEEFNRIEHLNYKRLQPGSRVLCTVLAVHPLALILSLPNQLLGHVPITSISTIYTQRLQDSADLDMDSGADSDSEADETISNIKNQATSNSLSPPELIDLYSPGQWVTASVVSINSPASLKASTSTGFGGGREGSEYERESKRVELTLNPVSVNTGIEASDLGSEFVLPVVIKSIEDHGYILDSGIEGLTGFCGFKDVPESHHSRLPIGMVLPARITSSSLEESKSRTFTATLNDRSISTAILSPHSRPIPSINGLLPGAMIQGLITASLPSGLNVKLFGMFDTTIDRSHLPPIPDGKEVKDVWKEGKKIKARVLWDLGDSGDAVGGSSEKGERKFGLSAATHVIERSNVMVPSPSSVSKVTTTTAKTAAASKQDLISLHEAFPIGTKLNSTVIHSSSDWGLEMSCSLPNATSLPFPLQGFVHISRVSDDHVVSLSTKAGSPFTLGSQHEARVIGHALTDGLLLLDLRPSVLNKTFLKVSDVEIGSLLKCTIKSVQSTGIFLDLNGSTDGVVFPLHFSDLVSPNSASGMGIKLARLEKKFKVGSTIRARVLDVQPDRNRITLTLKKSLVTSELEPLAHIEQAFVGKLCHGVVSKFLPSNQSGNEKSKGTGGPVLIDLFGGLRALLPTSEISDSFIEDPRAHFGGSEGKVVKVRITSIDMINGRLICSIRQAQSEFQSKLNVDSVELGEKVTGLLMAIHQDVVVMTLENNGTRALVSLKILAKVRDLEIEELREELKEGEKIEGLEVVTKNKEKGIVILGPVGTTEKAAKRTTSSKDKNGETETSNGSVELRIGQIHKARVIGTQSEPNAVTLLLPNKCKARLHLVDMVDDYSTLLSDKSTSTKFQSVSESLPKMDCYLEVCILNLRNSNRKADVSTRPSVISRAKGQPFPSNSESVVDMEVPCQNAQEAVKVLNPGMEVRGFVRNVAEGGLFVDLGANLTARVKIKEIEDGFTKDWKKGWKKEMLVKGKVLSIDANAARVEFSLRSTPSNDTKSALKKAKHDALVQAEASIKKLSDFSKGDKIKGFIRGKSDFGVFVQIEGTDVSGLCHKSQLSDEASAADALQAFSLGDKVKAVVLDVSEEKKKISFGLKPSYFEDEDFDDGDDEDQDGDVNMANGEEDSDEEEQNEEDSEDGDEMDASALLKQAGLDGGGSDEDEEMGSDEEMEDPQDSEEEEGEDYIEMDQDEDEAPVAVSSKKKAASKSSVPAPAALELAGGFSWSAREEDEDDQGLAASESESESEEEEEGETSKRANRRKKASKGKNIQEDITADLATRTPTSSTDFERMLLGSPNSSYLWIQFMSFQLQLSDVSRAREVARRALRVINFREEQEKLNVWIALLNLENSYGSIEEREKTFREASQANDAKTIYLRMNDILEKTGKLEEAEENWKKTTKKFGHSSKVWSGLAAFYLRQKKFEEARHLIPRSMQSLEKRKHVKTILSFALGEFRLGDPERGRVVFEGLVDSYPKRLDLWWQYIDQEARAGNISAARALFDRVLSLKQSSKKAKSVLKKWLAFEKRVGDPKGEQAVLKRAKEFVEEMKKKEMEAKGGQEEDEDLVG